MLDMIYADVLIEFELMQPHKVVICRMHQAAWQSKSNKKHKSEAACEKPGTIHSCITR
jgi:hypothetical protein